MDKERSDFIAAAVDRHRDLILDANKYIWENPETGYREVKTHAYLAGKFRALGYELTEAGDIPGFVTTLDTGRPGPTVLVFGELDALICPTHPEADPVTGAAHTCGHCCQVAGLLGVAAALKEKGVTDNMCGKIMLCAVPAEELIEVGFRTELLKKGIIKYFGGKPEFMYRGLLDGADLAFMIHTAGAPANVLRTSPGSDGCIAKVFTFKGKASHAGGSPEKGINALYAATNALNAINALRETFVEKDYIRVHPIITQGGTSVNIIPDQVFMESYIRGASMEAIEDANLKVNRAAAAAAAAIGGNLHIEDRPGYFVRRNDEQMIDVFGQACGDGTAIYEKTDRWSTGCSDIGDISAVMPVCHPHIGGAVGRAHGEDFFITDPESACVTSAKIQVKALELLLCDGGARARKIIDDYKPAFASKEEYFNYMDKLTLDKDVVIYNDDGTVTLSYK